VHRACDILDRLLAAVLIAKREPVAHLLIDGARDANASGVGEAL
jgi:hypothetical protein